MVPYSQEISQLFDFLFGNSSRLITGERAIFEARELKGLQPELWVHLLMLPRIKNSRSFAMDHVSELKQVLSDAFQIIEGEGQVELKGRIPILPSNVQQLIPTEFVGYVFGAALFELEHVLPSKFDMSQFLSEAPILAGFSMRAAKRIEAERSDILGRAVEDISLRARQATALEISKIEHSIKSYEKELSDMLIAQRSSVESIEDNWKITKKAISEFIPLSKSSLYWHSKRDWHLIAFSCSAGIFIISIVSLLWYTLAHFDWFSNLIPKKQDGSIEFGAAFLVLIPTAAAAWILRFISRFAFQQLTLAEDARNRATMLSTYLALVREEGSKFKAEGELVFLNSLFRSIPGHQADDVAPPTLTDLVRLKEP